MNLTDALNKCDSQTQGKFDKLSYEGKVIVRDAFKRHIAACEKNEIKPEPMFLTEIITEVKKGR